MCSSLTELLLHLLDAGGCCCCCPAGLHNWTHPHSPTTSHPAVRCRNIVVSGIQAHQTRLCCHCCTVGWSDATSQYVCEDNSHTRWCTGSLPSTLVLLNLTYPKVGRHPFDSCIFVKCRLLIWSEFTAMQCGIWEDWGSNTELTDKLSW